MIATKHAPRSDVRGARERLLDTASRLFYSEGVQTVGIDRILEESGVAKSTLYKAFGSKDALVRAYLQRRHDTTTQRLTDALAPVTNAREKILTVFDVQAHTFAEPGFNGCAFVAAAAEAAPAAASTTPQVNSGHGSERCSATSASNWAQNSPTRWPANSTPSTTAPAFPHAWTTTPASPSTHDRPQRYSSTPQ